MKICKQVFIGHLSIAWQESNQERDIQGTELQFSLQQAVLKKLLLFSQWSEGFVARQKHQVAQRLHLVTHKKHAEREKYF